MAILVAIPLSQVRDKLVQFIGVFDVWYSQRQQPKIAAAVLYSSVLVLILLSMTLGRIQRISEAEMCNALTHFLARPVVYTTIRASSTTVCELVVFHHRVESSIPKKLHYEPL
jgi:hypothetical protein